MKEKLSYRFGFFIKRPSILDIIIIVVLNILWICINYCNCIAVGYDLSLKFNIGFVLFFWVLPIGTPLVDKIRNIALFVPWTILVVLIYFKFASYNFRLDIASWPIQSLIISQLGRLIYKLKHSRYPIQLLINRYAFHRYSYLEKRNSDDDDFFFTLQIWMISCIIGLSTAFFLGLTIL